MKVKTYKKMKKIRQQRQRKYKEVALADGIVLKNMTHIEKDKDIKNGKK